MPCLSHPQVVRRALSVIDAHATEPVTIAELCRAAGVCERTLRNAFHDVCGVSPKQYLIRHGLEQAHSALQRARGARGAVTQVATECGFYELGRFAGAYRHLFGERPSDTLRASVAL
jgi:AraC family ethanolamine operon transcriptional activator